MVVVLPEPLGPQESDDLTLLDVERQVVDCHVGTEPLCDALHLDGSVGVRRLRWRVEGVGVGAFSLVRHSYLSSVYAADHENSFRTLETATAVAREL